MGRRTTGLYGVGMGVWVWVQLVRGVAGPNDGPNAPSRFSLLTFNLDNYLVAPVERRSVKSPTSRTAVHSVLLQLRADVVVLQELGGDAALRALRTSLRAGGLDYPYVERVQGMDRVIQLALLSRFPIWERRSQAQVPIRDFGEMYFVSRGLGEVELSIRPDYHVTVIFAHLKSKRPVGFADANRLRLKEAMALRAQVDRQLAESSDANLVVVGDLNDTPDSRVIKLIRGRGRARLLDARPELRWMSGEIVASPMVWTHYYPERDLYSRLDYILMSPGIEREWLPDASSVILMKDWLTASDHLPVVAHFTIGDR